MVLNFKKKKHEGCVEDAFDLIDPSGERDPHVSTNGNDLRINPVNDTIETYSNIVLPGNDVNLKKYFTASMVPNPSSEIITIASYGENINSISITDLSGNLIYVELSVNSSKLDVRISDLLPGAYFVNIKSYSGITKIFKLIKI